MATQQTYIFSRIQQMAMFDDHLSPRLDLMVAGGAGGENAVPMQPDSDIFLLHTKLHVKGRGCPASILAMNPDGNKMDKSEA